MTQTIKHKLNDSAAARWSALILVALMMFFAYMFVDMLSPIKTTVENVLHLRRYHPRQDGYPLHRYPLCKFDGRWCCD